MSRLTMVAVLYGHFAGGSLRLELPAPSSPAQGQGIAMNWAPLMILMLC